MSLILGKSFDRCYTMRLPFNGGFYNIGLFFNKKSSFLLFRIDSDFLNKNKKVGSKITLFKNLESSIFCETFLNLHNYKKTTLDIQNQFDSIKPEYFHEISFIVNETLTLSKIQIDDRFLYDTLTIYGFTLNSYSNEFIYLIAERQNIVKRLNRKIVRSTACQIGTSNSIMLIDEFHQESLLFGKKGLEKNIPTDEIIKLNDADIKLIEGKK